VGVLKQFCDHLDALVHPSAQADRAAALDRSRARLDTRVRGATVVNAS